jgi:hypothetical protein
MRSSVNLVTGFRVSTIQSILYNLRDRHVQLYQDTHFQLSIYNVVFLSEETVRIGAEHPSTLNSSQLSLMAVNFQNTILLWVSYERYFVLQCNVQVNEWVTNSLSAYIRDSVSEQLTALTASRLNWLADSQNSYLIIKVLTMSYIKFLVTHVTIIYGLTEKLTDWNSDIQTPLVSLNCG